MNILCKIDGRVDGRDTFPLRATPFVTSFGLLAESGSVVTSHKSLAGTGVYTAPVIVGVTGTYTPPNIHVGDVGVLFEVSIVDNYGNAITAANVSAVYLFEKPDGSLLTEDAAMMDGGKARYSIRNGDLDQSGTWKYQIVVFIGTQRFHTNVIKFKVLPNLPI